MRVLGIDPGTTRAGFGVIQKQGSSFVHITSGILDVPQPSTDAERLCAIEQSLQKLLHETSPDIVGIETLFFSRNKTTAFSVAQARGVMLLTITKAGIPVIELTPQQIKMGVTGYGRATKQGVAQMVEKILHIDTRGIVDDATDALAVAITASAHKA